MRIVICRRCGSRGYSASTDVLCRCGGRCREGKLDLQKGEAGTRIILAKAIKAIRENIASLL